MTIKFKLTYSIFKRVIKWFFYQIVSCAIPMVSGIFFTLFLGYRISIDKIFTDLLLCAFAIGINLSAIEINSEESIPEILRDLYKLFNQLVLGSAFFFYAILFNGGYITNYIQEISYNIPIPTLNCWVVVIILALLLLYDILIACYIELKK